jgi:hypothetical protein
MLRIVTQDLLLLYSYLCAGEDLPPSLGDTDEGYQ